MYENPTAHSHWVSFNLKAHLRNLERDIIREYMLATGGNKTQAAALLCMGRTKLVYRLKILGMTEWIEDTSPTNS